MPRDTQFSPRVQQHQPQPQQQPQPDVPVGLPAFITGGGAVNGAEQPAGNGHEQGERPDRFGRRRRRHRGGYRGERPDYNAGNAEGAAPQPAGGDEPPAE